MSQSTRPFLQRFFRGRNSAEKQFIAGTISPLVLYMAFWTIFPLLWGVALAFFDYSPRQTGGFLGFGGVAVSGVSDNDPDIAAAGAAVIGV